MVLIVLVFLLVAGIAFYQAVQGAFSALIMALLSILCAALAFEFYEPLARELLYGRQPAHADAVMLLALFILPLLLLRILTDRFIPSNVIMGLWPDRIAGAAMGLISGLIVAGVFTIVLQLLPTGPRFLMYRPFNDALQREQSLAPFYPDEFTIGLVNWMSGPGGSLGDARSFRQDHDNLLLESWCARNEANQVRKVDEEDRLERIGRMDAPPNSLTVLGCYDPNEVPWRDEIPKDPLMEERGETPGRILILRVAVEETARDKEDNWWRLPATHFRLVTRKKDLGPSAPAISHYPVAYLTGREILVTYESNTPGPISWKPISAALDDDRKAQVGRLTVARQWQREGGPKQLIVDWVYRVGADEEPDYVTFRRVAKKELAPFLPVKFGLPDADTALDRRVPKFSN